MAFSLFTTKQKQDKSLVLLVDIGSASVGVSLVHIEAGKPPHILSTVREDIALQGALTSAGFLVAMAHTLDRALKRVADARKGADAPAQVFCTLSSPWFMLKSRYLHVARETPFTVTKEKLEEFINEDIERLKEELKGTLPPKDVHIIEKKIIQMKLNGYDIKNPYGQTTARMEIGATVSVSSAKAVKRIEQAVRRFVGTPAIHFGAFPVAAFSAIRDIFPNEQQFIFLDITGEATDVSLIERDLLVGTVAFARGKNFFIREISAALRTPHQEAATLFNMFFAHTLEDVKYRQVERVIAHAEKEWVTRLEKTLGLFAAQGVLPRTLFFTADADTKDFFERLIKSANPGLLMSDGFEVRYLDQFIVGQFVSFESGVVRDPFAVVEALLAAKVLNEHNK